MKFGSLVKLVKHRVVEGIAVVVLAAPPLNALEQPVRAQLIDLLDALQARDDVGAICMTGEGVAFSAGLDLSDPAEKETRPTMRELCAAVENCRVPVVVGLRGAVMGRGVALALAAHHRLAEQKTTLALPEVSIGQIPSGGTTQRLARLAGADGAMSLMLGGRPVSASAAMERRIIDGIVSSNVQAAAYEMCKRLIEEGASPRKTSELRDGFADGIGYMQAIGTRRQELGKNLVAPVRIIDCVEAAAVLPFEVGCDYEEERLLECRKNPQAAALRHIFLAERQTNSKLTELDPETNRRTLKKSGEMVARALLTAQGQAGEAMVADGLTQEQIDGALVSAGYRRTPFGGTTASHANLAPDVTRKLTAAFMGAGARLLEDGTIEEPAAVDAISVQTGLMPRQTGGPMHAARAMGLLRLRNDMRKWSETANVWDVPPLLDEAVKYAKGFDAPELLGADVSPD